jgi:cytochrome c oxidase cbb3-type subunit 1
LNAFVYGFALQAGFGLALWMICRLGRTLLVGGRGIAAGALLWNGALALGVLGILAGRSTGHAWLELPRAVTPILLCGYFLIGVWALITLHLRRERSFYVSQWFLFAALLWFPWIYSTAQMLLVFFPVRGVMQEVVNGWYGRNLFELCLGPLGLAAIFYFLPKLLNRPLYSGYVALFGFWLLVLFGGWGGLRLGEPVPTWLGGVSSVSRVLLLVPVLAFAMSWLRTSLASGLVWRPDPALRFTLLAAGGYLLAALMETAAALPGVDKLTFFTFYNQGVLQLKIHGFLNMALAAGIYFVAPKVTGNAWPVPRLTQVHLWCSVVGVLLSAIPLLIGGLVQGAGMAEPQLDFMTVIRRTVPFLGTSTLGMTVLFLGYAAFLIHLGRLLAINCPCLAMANSLRSSLSASTASRGGKR